MCRWRSSGRFARGGLRGTGSTGTMIRVGFGADDDGQGAEGLLGKKQDLPEWVGSDVGVDIPLGKKPHYDLARSRSRYGYSKSVNVLCLVLIF